MSNRKQTSQLAESTLAKNPSRYADRVNTPQPVGTFGEAPLHLSPERLILWNEIVSQVPLGVLTFSDRAIVEIAAFLMEKLRNGAARPVDIGHLRAAIGSLGMTPADRSRASVAPIAPDPSKDNLSFLA